MAFLMLKKDVKRMKGNKNLEYYLDSRIYSTKEIEESMRRTKKEFPNKKIEVSIALNDFGVYIITFKFENKNNYLNKMWEKMKPAKRQVKYGSYNSEKIYEPY